MQRHATQRSGGRQGHVNKQEGCPYVRSIAACQHVVISKYTLGSAKVSLSLPPS